MKIKRSHALAVLLGLGVTGVIGASAASLGGATANDLGADATTVASCDTNGVSLANWTTSGINVSGVTVNGIASPSCDGQTLKVSLYNSSGTLLGSSAPATVSGASQSVSFSGSLDAEAVTNVAVVISG